MAIVVHPRRVDPRRVLAMLRCETMTYDALWREYDRIVELTGYYPDDDPDEYPELLHRIRANRERLRRLYGTNYVYRDISGLSPGCFIV